MRRWWGLSIGVLACVLAVGPVPAEPASETASKPPTLERLGWLAGCWCAEGEGAFEEECWLAPRGGVMPGVHRDVSASGKAFIEFLRLVAAEEGVIYFASPGGGKTTPFPLVHLGVEEAIFENPGHDWPQRLVYRRSDDGRLEVRAEALGGERPRAWSWHPCPGRLAGPLPTAPP